MVCETFVVTEHVEQWRFHTGEIIDHPFTSVMEITDGLIFVGMIIRILVICLIKHRNGGLITYCWLAR